MAIGSKPLNSITKDELLALVSDGARELMTLEFKRDLPGQSDGDRKEFFYDVASLPIPLAAI